MQRISRTELGAMRIAWPPLHEQREIARHLNTALLRVKGLAQAAHKVIDLLRERRSALIAAAVTGKIDVRATR